MTKVKYYDLSEKEKKQYFDDFYSMVSLLQDKEEIQNFFKDLLTPSEMVMISRRIQIAKMLMKGATHEDIREELGVGNTTISYVDKWLNEGFGGYKNIVSKHKAKNKKGKEIKINEGGLPFSLDHLRKKYPAHFLLINLLKGDN